MKNKDYQYDPKSKKVIQKCELICGFNTKIHPAPYDGVYSNCASYAVDEWYRHTGEYISGKGMPEYNPKSKDIQPPDALGAIGRYFTHNPSSLYRNIKNSN